MRITFDRQAYKDETSILTNFEKKYDFTSDARIIDLLKKFSYQYLRDTNALNHRWKVLGIKGTEYVDLAYLDGGELKNINSGDLLISNFFGKEEKITVFGLIMPPEEGMTIGNFHLNNMNLPKITEFPWKKIQDPILINTKGKQSMAMLSLSIGVLFLVYTLWVYHETKGDIFLPGIALAVIFFALFYYLLSIGRKIEFRDSFIIYRNRHNRYETFNALDIDHLAWVDGGENQSVVFKYHKLSRNVINFKTDNYLDIVVWAIHNEIPLYSLSKKESFLGAA